MAKWTPEEVEEVKKLIESGKNSTDIAPIIGRTAPQIRALASEKGFKISHTKPPADIEDYRKKAEVAGWVSNTLLEKIEIPASTIGSEAVAFAVASDWHFEETIELESVMGYNEYNLEIARSRASLFFSNSLKLTNMFSRDISIKTVVVPLLGDLMSGYIHEELMESNSLSPTETIIELKKVICSGFRYMLENSDYEFIIPCAIGNHGRTTEKMRVSTSYKNSYEWLLYHQIKDEFKNENRIKFLIPNAYFVELKIYGRLIRLHHGNNIRYGGGVGGITIPVNKAISQWDKLQQADLDVFGHYHQFMVTKKFVSNGSLIGYGPYAMSIKAEPEPPQQAFFLYDKEHGKTVSCPVFLK